MKCRVGTVLALLGSLISCNKENPEEKKDVQQTFSVMAPTVKASVSGNTVFWNKNDKIAFYGGQEHASAIFQTKISASAVKATFSSTGTAAVKDKNYYMAVYPATAPSAWGKAGEQKAVCAIPSKQTDSGNGWDSSACLMAASSAGTNLTMCHLASFIRFTVNETSLKFKTIEVVSDSTEPLAGGVSVSFSKGTPSCESIDQDAKSAVTFASTATCFTTGVYYIAIRPGTYSKGLTIHFLDARGTPVRTETLIYADLQAGSLKDLGVVPSPEGNRQVLICGQDKVHLVDMTKVSWGGEYTDGLLWSWNCTSIDAQYKKCDIDEAIPVNNGEELLVTSARLGNGQTGGWCAHLRPDYVNGGAQVLFFSNQCRNAHSAEVLPGGYIAVACSTGADCIKVFNPANPDEPIGSYHLESAHGVVWNPSSSRLYAIGTTNLQIYTLNSATGALTLEKTVSTASYVTGLHSLSLCDGNTLALGGTHRAALYNISEGKFTGITWFNDTFTQGIKSLNYNPATGEAFYTFAVEGTAEGSTTTHTKTLRYCDDINIVYALEKEKQIKVPDLEFYKTRVLHW